MPFAPKPPDSPATLALGCMNFGGRTPRAEALAVIAAAIEAGVEVLDTANVYGEGASERIVGEALRGAGTRGVRVATKVGLGRVAGRPEGLAPARVRAACEESLSRLGVDTIDLFYLHAPDALTPPEATLEAIRGLLEAGKIRAWGVSNFAAWQILELRGLAERAGMPGPAAAQQLYNALVRQLDVEYFAFARRFPIHTTVYNPLAGGLLAGGHRFEAPPARGTRFDKNTLYRRRYWQRSAFEAVEAMRAVAEAEGMSLVTLAYAFALGRPGVDSVLAGPASLPHLADALHARTVTLSLEVLRRLDALHVELVGTDARYARVGA